MSNDAYKFSDKTSNEAQEMFYGNRMLMALMVESLTDRVVDYVDSNDKVHFTGDGGQNE